MKKILMGLLVVVVAGVAVVMLSRTDAPQEQPVVEQVAADPAPAVIPTTAPAPSGETVDPEAVKLALENELAAARRELTTLRKKAVPGAAEKTEEAKEEKPASFMDAFASMMDSPDMQQMMKVQQRMALDQSHGELIRGMNLDAEQADQFKDLLVARNMSAMTAGLQHMKGEAGATDGEDLKASMDVFNDQIRELLGEDGYDMFEQFEDTQMERMQVDMFKERLRGDLALDWDTQDKLIRSMAEARKASPASSAMESMSQNAGMPDPEMLDQVMSHMDNIQASYLEGAADILNEEQLAVFEESLKQYATMQKAGLEMAKGMFGGLEEGDE